MLEWAKHDNHYSMHIIHTGLYRSATKEDMAKHRIQSAEQLVRLCDKLTKEVSLCIYLCVYVCMHVCVCMWYVCIHLCVCVCACACVCCVCLCVCECARVCLLVGVHTHTVYIQIFKNVIYVVFVANWSSMKFSSLYWMAKL